MNKATGLQLLPINDCSKYEDASNNVIFMTVKMPSKAPCAFSFIHLDKLNLLVIKVGEVPRFADKIFITFTFRFHSYQSLSL